MAFRRASSILATQVTWEACCRCARVAGGRAGGSRGGAVLGGICFADCRVVPPLPRLVSFLKVDKHELTALSL